MSPEGGFETVVQRQQPFLADYLGQAVEKAGIPRRRGFVLKPDFEELKRDDEEGLCRACRCAGEDGEGLCDSWCIENVLVEGREGVVC
jgi:hypothetical protein